MARLEPPLNDFEKVYVGPFFGALSQEMRHINFFLGAQNGVFWVGAEKFTLPESGHEREQKSRGESEKSRKTRFWTFSRLFGLSSRLFSDFWGPRVQGLF